MRYPHEEIESKWQKFWEDKQVYKTDFSKTDKKLYHLNMFIYPSGAKLHTGHWYHYGPSDSWARYKRLSGFNVFEPMGYDAFGLPAENFAIQTGIHPKDSTLKNIKDIKEQLKHIGCMYDWNAELMTCVPEYYKWNQWLFLQLYKKGLAYRKKAPVNWCPKDQTVLANEQVHDGKCERCGTEVIQKNLYQWFFKITEYAEELLLALDTINWPEKTKLMQRNWIGKSIGAEVDFQIADSDEKIKIFTTRPDTLFGATYIVLAPEHPLVERLTTSEQKSKVDAYLDSIKSLTEIERTSTVKEKTGVFTGAYTINPVNNKRIPIWIADYVLLTYGTGAIMAVPGQDERDWEFAEKFDLPIVRTVQPPDDFNGKAYLEDGPAINSDFLNGLYVEDAKKKINQWLEAEGIGKATINYRLRDWLISRQRYWGTPIPIIHCEKCGEVSVDEKDLPVELPYDVDFKLGGESPLARNEKYINVECPKCGGNAKRDPDTMDTFVDSSWYYFRFLNPKFSEGIFDKSIADNWVPVDMYVGGAEHATMHLLYARFIHKFLRDLGIAKGDEPFKTLVHQGTITNAGAKMSKSKGNVVNPDLFTSKYGSDVFRLYLMFMGPYDMGGDWSDKGITGTDRFVNRVYDLFNEYKDLQNQVSAKEKYDLSSLSDTDKFIYRKVNQTLNKVGEETNHFRFNTAIAALMELMNNFKDLSNCTKEIQLFSLQRFAVMLSPLAPHLGEECWSLLGNSSSIFEKPFWYEVDESALIEDTVSIAVQVNGKVRATIDMPLDASAEETGSAAKSDNKVKKFIEGKNIVKEIFVKNKILNIVVKDQIVISEKAKIKEEPKLTRTEKYVFELSKKSFLSLWSYPVPKGKHDNELCDVLIFCEPDIIIISVKEIIPTDSGNFNVDLERWKKTALEKSYDQLYGAERYLNSINQLKLFDGSPGPILPKVKERKYHRVAIVIGGEKKMPLLWGDMGKGFIHVFDEISTSILLTELNTITDFTKYLTKKEEFYTSGNFRKLIFNGGEEDLLAFYLDNSEEFITKGTLTILDDDLWGGYKVSEANKKWIEDIEVSFIWDNLIETLIEDFNNDRMEVGKKYEDFELVVRTMARESRYNRILLSKEFLNFINSPQVRARPVASYSGIVYVFMTANRNESREDRRLELAGRCLIVRKNTSNIDTVIGIATEKQDGKKGFSMDVVYLFKPQLSAEEEAKADEFVQEFGWFKNSFNKKS